jgi:rare lipoprotein A
MLYKITLIALIFIVACQPEEANFRQTGESSYYADFFNGRQTANGEVFQNDSLFAAHRTLPLNTIITVKNLENGKKIKLRVNDRGPYAKDRILDVSRRAADSLNFLEEGVARVEITASLPDSVAKKLNDDGAI